MALQMPTPKLLAEWRAVQKKISDRVVDSDDVSWSLTDDGLPPPGAEPLFCAGVDVSYSLTDVSAAVSTLTVVSLASNGESRCVYSSSANVVMAVPYASTFLAFREAPVVSKMISEMPPELLKRVDVLLLDGNGRLHPLGAGLACHVALETGTCGLPTIGCSKSLMRIDGLSEKAARSSVVALPHGEALPLIGVSGRTWGVAILTGNSTSKPIYVSVGHRVSISTATKLVRALCLYRIPEPIRLADQHSREALRGNVIAIRYAS
jgi:endonuclease V